MLSLRQGMGENRGKHKFTVTTIRLSELTSHAIQHVVMILSLILGTI
jgi:hypothetical protein